MVSVVEARVITVATAHHDSTGNLRPEHVVADLAACRRLRLDAGEALDQRDVAERIGGALGQIGLVALDRASAAFRSC